MLGALSATQALADCFSRSMYKRQCTMTHHYFSGLGCGALPLRRASVAARFRIVSARAQRLADGEGLA
jgi:hypothetical protein